MTNKTQNETSQNEMNKNLYSWTSMQKFESNLILAYLWLVVVRATHSELRYGVKSFFHFLRFDKMSKK